MPTKLNTEILTAAIEGFEVQKAGLTAQIADLPVDAFRWPRQGCCRHTGSADTETKEILRYFPSKDGTRTEKAMGGNQRIIASHFETHKAETKTEQSW